MRSPPSDVSSTDVDQPGRAFDILFHQIDQVGAARDEFGGRVGSDPANRVGDVVGPRVLEIDHGLPPILPIACSIAATMFG
jgi:hypothetical protein